MKNKPFVFLSILFFLPVLLWVWFLWVLYEVGSFRESYCFNQRNIFICEGYYNAPKEYMYVFTQDLYDMQIKFPQKTMPLSALSMTDLEQMYGKQRYDADSEETKHYIIGRMHFLFSDTKLYSLTFVNSNLDTYPPNNHLVEPAIIIHNRYLLPSLMFNQKEIYKIFGKSHKRNFYLNITV